MRASLTLASVLLLLAGCSPSPTQNADAGITVPDSGQPPTPTCGDPGEPYGTSVGSHFLPFTLAQCDGTPFEFYGEDEGFCDARFTVLTMAAGWCNPCRIEAAQMQDRLVEAYADQGVRVVVAVIQDNDYRVPDAAFCQSWVDQYDLTNPVVLDPLQETQIYFPAGALPATVIVDSRGVIRHREYGVSTGLETIRSALDALLAQ
jgi:thiol-disulfide isomerase/thioredoxin